MVDEESQAAHRDDQELHPESVVVAIVGGFELGVDQVHQGVGTSDVNDLYIKHANVHSGFMKYYEVNIFQHCVTIRATT